jgi:quinol monooxygenase YgiN
MYGIINRFTAHPGKRDELIAAMTSDEGGLEGCRSFVVAHDLSDPDAIWLTEVWDSKAHWQASLERPGVKESIAVAIPLVLDWGRTVETEVVRVLPV